jgi:imidazolonepropionase-like amidohydrolase
MKQRVPVMKTDVLEAIVDEAHREGLKVFVHAPLLDHAKTALRAGADGLLHGIIDRAVDRELVDLMVRNRTVYVPTLAMFEDVADVAAWGRRQAAHDEGRLVAPLANAFAGGAEGKQFAALFDNTAYVQARLGTLRANLKTLADAGVSIVMGTDTGFYGVIAGVASQLELVLMVEAGLTPAAALRAATIEAARMIGREKDFGSVEAGKAADLLVLDANPLEQIVNVRRIHRVVRGGVVHEPAALLQGIRFGPLPPPAR